MKRLRLMLVRLLALVPLVVLAYFALLFLLQRRLLFPAPPVAGAPPRPSDARQVFLESSAGRTEAWFLAAAGPTERPTPLLLFAHGNGELINHWPGEFIAARRLGLAVLLVEYPGYGGSGGSPSRESIQAVFETAYDWAASEPSVDPHRIVLYGRSLGGAVVAALSLTRPAAAMVLESTFTSTMAFARAFGAPAFLVRDRFDSLQAVARFRRPLLVLHGMHDRIVPVDHGRRLAAARGVPLRLFDCGHNDCPGPSQLLPSFLGEAGILRGPG